MDNLLRALAAVVVLAACAPAVSEDGRRCPCAAGWVCCEGNNVCVRDAASCLSSQNPPPPPPPPGDTIAPAAPSLDASIPASPTNASQVDVTGIAEIGARVEVFTNAACAAPAAGTGIVDAAGSYRITVAVAPNATTRFWAHAVDAAGNVSTCASHSLEVLQDSEPPAVPALKTVSPAVLSNSVLEPQLSGTGDPRSVVILYSGAGCVQELPFTGVVDVTGAFRISARVEPNTATVFAARAVDAVGNVSACSPSTLRFEHDDTPPVAPSVSGTSPVSPSVEPVPTVTVAAEPAASVELYGAAGCAGAMLEVAPAAADGTAVFTVAVTHNATTAFSARAVDAAGNPSDCGPPLSYVHDDTPPAAVVWNSVTFSPQSPSQSTEIVAQAWVPSWEPGEKVRIHASAIGSPDWWTTADVQFGRFQAPISVAANASTYVWVATIDALGNAGSETFGGEFVNDTIAPSIPSVVSTSVPAPSRGDNAFSVAGLGDPGAHIELWSDAACGQPWPDSGAFGLSRVRDDGSYQAYAGWVVAGGSTDVYATAIDDAGNRSPCSRTHVSFAHTLTGPGWGYTMTADTGMSRGIVMTPAGNAFGLEAVSGGSTADTIGVVSAGPGAFWSTPEPAAAIAANINVDPVLMNAEGENLLVLWGQSTITTGEVHARVRGEGGAWADEQILSTHAVPCSWIRSAATVEDRAGGVWAAWLATDIRTNSPGGEELWIAHHTQAGWSSPLRMAMAWQFGSFRMASAKSGNAVLAWDGTSAMIGGTVSHRIAFFDAQQGWSAAEDLDPASSSMPLIMDDDGNAIVTSWSAGALGTRTHRPATGWEAAVTEQLEGNLGTSTLTNNASGDVLLTWKVEGGPLFVKRYSALTGWSAAEKVPVAVGSYTSTSFGTDGSIWMLASGIDAPVHFYGTPTWLLRYDVAGGWAPPQIVIDDSAACSQYSCRPATAWLVRDDLGHAMLHWWNYGTFAFADSRWYY